MRRSVHPSIAKAAEENKQKTWPQKWNCFKMILRPLYIYIQSIIDYMCILTTKLYKSMMYRLYRSCRITVLKKISPKTFRRATTAILLSRTTCCFPSIRTGYLQMSGTHLPAQPWSRAVIPLYYFIHWDPYHGSLIIINPIIVGQYNPFCKQTATKPRFLPLTWLCFKLVLSGQVPCIPWEPVTRVCWATWAPRMEHLESTLVPKRWGETEPGRLRPWNRMGGIWIYG